MSYLYSVSYHFDCMNLYIWQFSFQAASACAWWSCCNCEGARSEVSVRSCSQMTARSLRWATQSWRGCGIFVQTTWPLVFPRKGLHHCVSLFLFAVTFERQLVRNLICWRRQFAACISVLCTHLSVVCVRLDFSCSICSARLYAVCFIQFFNNLHWSM